MTIKDDSGRSIGFTVGFCVSGYQSVSGQILSTRSIATAQDAVTKRRCVVEINTKAEFEDGCGPSQGARIRWEGTGYGAIALPHFVPLAQLGVLTGVPSQDGL